MHEFSAAMSIVETALQAAEEHQATRVMRVNVDVGEFTFLVFEQLIFNFEIASKNTILEGAELKLHTIRGRLRCSECGFEGETQPDPTLPPEIAVFAPMKCPKCGSAATEITGGKEFFITDIEAEIADSN
ncbi:MAG: hydrogenase maturation nickel metallochaperone HypA [Candidatus Thorarchaeota archaeon]